MHGIVWRVGLHCIVLRYIWYWIVFAMVCYGIPYATTLYCIALSEANSFDHNGCLHTPAGIEGKRWNRKTTIMTQASLQCIRIILFERFEQHGCLDTLILLAWKDKRYEIMMTPTVATQIILVWPCGEMLGGHQVRYQKAPRWSFYQ